MTPDRIKELEALCEAATPEPWQTRFIYRMICAGRDAPDHALIYNTDPKQDWPDAAFIATARQALPECLAEIKRLQGELKTAATRVAYLVRPDDPDSEYKRGVYAAVKVLDDLADAKEIK